MYIDLLTDITAQAHLAEERGLKRQLNIGRVRIPRAGRAMPPVFRIDGKY
jgi:hypothetical protein